VVGRLGSRPQCSEDGRIREELAARMIFRPRGAKLGACDESQAGVRVRAAPTRGPNGVVCPPARRCGARARMVRAAGSWNVNAASFASQAGLATSPEQTTSTETRVLKSFQERMPCGLFVADIDVA
jgi:hypothetical protein